MLKNLSGISSSFNFNSDKFEPLSHKAPSNKSEVAKALEAEALRKREAQKEADLSPSKKKTIRFAPGLSQTETENKR